MKKWKSKTSKGFKLKYIGLDSELGCYFASIEKAKGSEVVEWFTVNGEPADHSYGNLVSIEPQIIKTHYHAVVGHHLSRRLEKQPKEAKGYVAIDFYDDGNFKVRTLDNLPDGFGRNRRTIIRSESNAALGDDQSENQG